MWRNITFQATGCDWDVWFQIVERGLETSLVLEDDLRFEVFFKRRLQALLQEVTTHRLDWDLMWVASSRGQMILKQIFTQQSSL